MMIFPFSLVLMYGRMLKRVRHSVVIFSVMLVLMVGTVVWVIYFDTMKPNPGIYTFLAPNRRPFDRNKAQRDLGCGISVDESSTTSTSNSVKDHIFVASRELCIDWSGCHSSFVTNKPSPIVKA
jgi:K+-transporting ATPase A subunit